MLSRVTEYILWAIKLPSKECHAVTFPDFGRKVHLIAVFQPFLDLIDVFEEFIVSFWAIKLTIQGMSRFGIWAIRLTL